MVHALLFVTYFKTILSNAKNTDPDTDPNVLSTKTELWMKSIVNDAILSHVGISEADDVTDEYNNVDDNNGNENDNEDTKTINTPLTNIKVTHCKSGYRNFVLLMLKGK